MRLRIAVADDVVEVRDAVTALLDADDRYDVVGAAADGDEAETVVDATSPDIVLLDLVMPGGGAGLVRRLLSRRPGLAVVVYTAEDREVILQGLVDAGARAVIVKGNGGDLGDDVWAAVDRGA